MVLPLLILIILSLIMLMIYFFACLNTQVELHSSLVEEGRKSKAYFKIVRQEDSTGEQMKGFSKLFMSHTSSARCYVFNETASIRLGEAINEHFKE